MSGTSYLLTEMFKWLIDFNGFAKQCYTLSHEFNYTDYILFCVISIALNFNFN